MIIWLVPDIKGPSFGVLFIRNNTILGSTFGPLIFGNSHINRLHGFKHVARGRWFGDTPKYVKPGRVPSATPKYPGPRSLCGS